MCFSNPLLPRAAGSIDQQRLMVKFVAIFPPCFNECIFILLQVNYFTLLQAVCFHTILSDWIQLSLSEFHPASTDVISVQFYWITLLCFTRIQPLSQIIQHWSTVCEIFEWICDTWNPYFVVKSTWIWHISSRHRTLVMYMYIFNSSFWILLMQDFSLVQHVHVFEDVEINVSCMLASFFKLHICHPYFT